MNLDENQLGYVAQVVVVSIVLVMIVGNIFGTNDGTISYLLSLIASHFIIKELKTMQKPQE